MKTIIKIMFGLVMSLFMVLNLNAQPKSEIPESNEKKINWAEADTLYTFNYDQASETWTYFQREIRRFNGHELPVENFVQAWNKDTESWTNYLKVNYTFDKNGNELEEITQEWDNSFNSWLNAKLKTTTYKGRKREEILFQEWKQPTNEWFNIIKYLISYNDNGVENSITINLYNGITNQWDKHKRFVMEFDNVFSPPTEVISESWVGNKWETKGKYEIRYDARGNKTFEKRYTWNPSNSIWLEGLKFEMTYDKKGNQIEHLESKYDYTNNTWVQFNKISAVYNETGYMTEKTELYWNRNSNQWEVKGQYRFTTDSSI